MNKSFFTYYTFFVWLSILLSCSDRRQHTNESNSKKDYIDVVFWPGCIETLVNIDCDAIKSSINDLKKQYLDTIVYVNKNLYDSLTTAIKRTLQEQNVNKDCDCRLYLKYNCYELCLGEEPWSAKDITGNTKKISPEDHYLICSSCLYYNYFPPEELAQGCFSMDSPCA